MHRPSTTSKPTKRVTKSIRLTETEAEELAHLVAGTAYAEAALMRQWVLIGMRQFRIVEAIRAYQEGEADLRQTAEAAHLPVAVLLEEMAMIYCSLAVVVLFMQYLSRMLRKCHPLLKIGAVPKMASHVPDGNRTESRVKRFTRWVIIELDGGDPLARSASHAQHPECRTETCTQAREPLGYLW